MRPEHDIQNARKNLEITLKEIRNKNNPDFNLIWKYRDQLEIYNWVLEDLKEIVPKEYTCPKCHASNPVKATYCHQCGKSIIPAAPYLPPTPTLDSLTTYDHNRERLYGEFDFADRMISRTCEHCKHFERRYNADHTGYDNRCLAYQGYHLPSICNDFTCKTFAPQEGVDFCPICQYYVIMDVSYEKEKRLFHNACPCCKTRIFSNDCRYTLSWWERLRIRYSKKNTPSGGDDMRWCGGGAIPRFSC